MYTSVQILGFQLVKHLNSMFSVFRISPYLIHRFKKAFNTTGIELISIRGNHFVLVNSMALEGDGCFLCRPAEAELTRIESVYFLTI